MRAKPSHGHGVVRTGLFVIEVGWCVVERCGKLQSPDGAQDTTDSTASDRRMYVK